MSLSPTLSHALEGEKTHAFQKSWLLGKVGRGAVYTANIQTGAQLPSSSLVVTQPDQNILLSNLVLFEKKQYSQFLLELYFTDSLVS